MNEQKERIISPAVPDDYEELTLVWEASVRATHHFLREEDVLFFRPLVRNEFLRSVDLYCVRNAQGRIMGFLGLSADKIEMLFIHPATRGQGIGKVLLLFAVHQKGICKVDVNEQNTAAVGFYQRMGFAVRGRSDRDAMGKPFPVLFLEWEGS